MPPRFRAVARASVHCIGELAAVALFLATLGLWAAILCRVI